MEFKAESFSCSFVSLCGKEAIQQKPKTNGGIMKFTHINQLCDVVLGVRLFAPFRG
jgi:hypothetical protein